MTIEEWNQAAFNERFNWWIQLTREEQRQWFNALSYNDKILFWNNATFEEVLFLCLGSLEQTLFHNIYNELMKVNSSFHKACVCYTVGRDFHFVPFVFISQNNIISKRNANYIVGINMFQAYSQKNLDTHPIAYDNSRQVSHSERAITAYFSKNRVLLQSSILLIKNILPTCNNCISCLKGKAPYIYDIKGYIYYIADSKSAFRKFSHHHNIYFSWKLLLMGLMTTTSYCIRNEDQVGSEIEEFICEYRKE